MKSRSVNLLLFFLFFLAVSPVSANSTSRQEIQNQDPLPPTQIAVVREGNIWLVDLREGGAEEQLTDLGEDCCLKWSPDGQFLFFARFDTVRLEHGIYAYSMETGISVNLSLPGGKLNSHFDISPDGTEIAYVTTREISPRQGEYLLLEIESCLMTYDLITGESQQRECFRDLSVGEIDYDSTGEQLAMSIGGFEYSEVGVFIFNGNYYLPMGCCWDPIFVSSGGEFLVTGSSYYIGQLREGDASFGVFRLRIAPSVFDMVFASTVPIDLSELSFDGTQLLYAEAGAVNVYDFPSQTSNFITSGSWPAWRPAVPQTLSDQFGAWFDTKHHLINALEQPYLFNFEISTAENNEPIVDWEISFPESLTGIKWGYDEKSSEDILEKLDEDYEDYLAGEMSPEQIEQFLNASEAFGRLVLVEQGFLDAHDNFHDTASNLSDNMVNAVTIPASTIVVTNIGAEKIISQSPWLARIINPIKQRLENRIWSLVNNFVQISLGTTPDAERRELLLTIWETVNLGIETKIQAGIDPDGWKYESLMETLLGESVKQGVVYWILKDNFVDTQPLLEQAVTRVEINPESNISGSFLQAENHVQQFSTNANLYTEVINEQHDAFQQSIRWTEIGSAIGFISTGPTMGWGALLGTISSAVGIAINHYDTTCQVQHLAYLQGNLVSIVDYAYSADRELIASLPTHCDRLPETSWLETADLVASTSSIYSGTSIEIINLAETEVGDDILSVQTILREMENAVISGDPAMVETQLFAFIDAETGLTTKLALTAREIAVEDGFDVLHPFLNVSSQYDVDTISLYGDLIGYFASPNNPEAETILLARIDMVDQTLAELADVPLPVSQAANDLDNASAQILIANVQTSLQIEENQSSTVTILVATSGNYDEPITLAVADGQSRIAVSEAIDFSTNEQQAVELEIPGYSIGDHLLFAQIEDKNGAVLDSRPFTLNVMSPELYAAVSASTSQENDENADHVDEDKVFVPSATSGENVSKGVYIGFASVIVLIGLGGGFTLLRRDQKGVAGASVAGSIIFAAGLMYIGMGKMSAPEVPSPTTQPTATAQQELSMVSLDTIEKDIASTAAALVAFLPTATPTPLPTTTSTPEPTFTPTPVGRGERLEIGKTVTGQTIEAIRFGDGSNVIVIVGGIHAGTAPSSVQIAQQLGSYYLTNPDRLPGHITLYIIENLNLDSIYAPGNIRGRFNSNGVDLNRNWDCRWEADVDVFGEFVVGAGGDEPFSEPESQALKSFIEEVNPELVLFYEARATNGYVVPGGCNVRHEPSESFSVNYANAAGYRLADFEEVISDTIHGDASNYFASIDIPSIFVILPHYELVNLAENVNGLNTVMEQID